MNTTHHASNVTLFKQNYYNLTLLSLFHLLQGTSTFLETNCKHLINFNALDIDVSNLVIGFNHIPIFERCVIRYSSKEE